MEGFHGAGRYGAEAGRVVEAVVLGVRIRTAPEALGWWHACPCADGTYGEALGEGFVAGMARIQRGVFGPAGKVPASRFPLYSKISRQGWGSRVRSFAWEVDRG